MFKKIGVTLLLAGAVFLAVPSAANAVDYVPVPADLGGEGTSQNAPGEAQEVVFDDTAFFASEEVRVTVDGEPTPELAAIKGSVSKIYTSGGAGGLKFKVIVPSTATASSIYQISAVGLTSNAIGTYVITVVTPDGEPLLSATGATISALSIWGGAGVLLIGGALITVRTLSRRKMVAAN